MYVDMFIANFTITIDSRFVLFWRHYGIMQIKNTH